MREVYKPENMNKFEEFRLKNKDALYQTLVWISPLLNESLGQAEPPDEYKRDGMLAYSDGTTWDAGSGKGLYRYESGTGWVFIG